MCVWEAYKRNTKCPLLNDQSYINYEFGPVGVYCTIKKTEKAAADLGRLRRGTAKWKGEPRWKESSAVYVLYI
jgi:hypothetical protein